MPKRIINEENKKMNESPNKSQEKEKTEKMKSNTNKEVKKINIFKRFTQFDRKKLISQAVTVSLILLVGIGAMAQMGLLPHHDKKTGKKYGWFGSELPKNATSLWNPLAAPASSSKIVLAEEYVYAGDRLITIEQGDPCAGGNVPGCVYPENTPTPTPVLRVNYALASNGATATASSTYSSAWSTGAAINGDRRSYPWNSNGYWSDATNHNFPDWLQVDFDGSKTIDEIIVVTLRDNYSSADSVQESDLFTLYGNTDFDVQYWDGSNWVTVPNGSITNNNNVVRKIQFSPITTPKIRVVVNDAVYSNVHYSAVAELEAWGNDTPPPSPTESTWADYTSSFDLLSDNRLRTNQNISASPPIAAKGTTALSIDEVGEYYEFEIPSATSSGKAQAQYADLTKFATITFDAGTCKIYYRPGGPVLKTTFSCSQGDKFKVQVIDLGGGAKSLEIFHNGISKWAFSGNEVITGAIVGRIVINRNGETGIIAKPFVFLTN